MKNFIKTTTAFCLAALGMLSLMSCEGADLYKVNAPDWLADMELEEEELNIVEVTPSPEVLGETNNSTPWWTVFTDDIKAEPGMTYQVKFINYGGNSNYKNFLIVLRNEAKNVEYAVLRADNWGWTSADTDGANSDKYFMKKMESDSRDWPTWLKAMSMAKCTATIANYGNGKCDVKISMLGADNVTYTQEYTDISVDQDDLYFSFTCEGSHLEFGDFDVEDSEPVSLTLNGVPTEVIIGTTLEEMLESVTAMVTFENNVTKDIVASDLQFELIPDMTETGTKTLVAVYNKTYLGENCSKPVIASKTFTVVKEFSAFTETLVVPTPHVLGAENNSTAFWQMHSNNIKVEPKETKVVHFTNYTNGVGNWNNFVVILNGADVSKEYGVVRADNWGWGPGIDGNGAFQKVGGFGDDDAAWAAWRQAMDGAKVTAYITNNGDGTADIKCIMYGTDDKEYTQTYTGINTIDPEDMYFRFTVDGSHLVFDNDLGAPDCSTPWWTVFTQNVKVDPSQVATFNFTNYTNGVGNWNNFVVILNGADVSKEYGVVRADNWGWGPGIDGNGAFQKVGGFGDDDAAWAAWRQAMNGAKVKLTVANNGNGTVNIKAVMTGNNGTEYIQEYNNINTIDPDDLYVRFTVDGSHLVFE